MCEMRFYLLLIVFLARLTLLCFFVIQFYRVIMLVPDIIDRLLYKDFMNVLLLQLEFEAAIIHQV